MFLAASLISKDTFSRNPDRRLGDTPVKQPGRLPSAGRFRFVLGSGFRESVNGIIDAIATDTLVGSTTVGKIYSAGFNTVSVIGA